MMMRRRACCSPISSGLQPTTTTEDGIASCGEALSTRLSALSASPFLCLRLRSRASTRTRRRRRREGKRDNAAVLLIGREAGRCIRQRLAERRGRTRASSDCCGGVSSGAMSRTPKSGRMWASTASRSAALRCAWTKRRAASPSPPPSTSELHAPASPALSATALRRRAPSWSSTPATSRPHCPRQVRLPGRRAPSLPPRISIVAARGWAAGAGERLVAGAGEWFVVGVDKWCDERLARAHRRKGRRGARAPARPGLGDMVREGAA